MATLQERNDVETIRKLVEARFPCAVVFNDKRPHYRRLKLWTGAFESAKEALDYATLIAQEAKKAGVKAKITPTVSPPQLDTYRPHRGCPVWQLTY